MSVSYHLPNLAGHCLGCNCRLPAPFLDLGETPLANRLLAPEDAEKEEPYFKLAVAHCPQCQLVQLTHRIDPEILYDRYLYFSSCSDAFLQHARKMAEDLAVRFRLGAQSLVMEVASNDGYLLQFFREQGIGVLGIDPAKNIAQAANQKGIPTLDVFFSPETAERICREKGRADLLIGNNVLAHVPEINGFFAAVKTCLKPGGVAVFEFPHLLSLLANVEFDTIYHEHVFYYSLLAVQNLAERAGLALFDAEEQDVHGGSVRVFLHRENLLRKSDRLLALLEKERQEGLTSPERFKNFAKRVEEIKKRLGRHLVSLKRDGKTIAAYGAAAKGNTLLNVCGIGKEILDFAVDRNPQKQNLQLPGTRIPVLPVEELVRRRPDYTLLLAWNFADEIIRQQSAYLKAGGRFIVPIPETRIIP